MLISVISLKRHIDSISSARHEDFTDVYLTLLRAVIASASRAVPDLDDRLSEQLPVLERSASAPGQWDQTNKLVEGELVDWAERAHHLHEENRTEIKEILDGISAIAQSFAMRDLKSGREITEMTQKMRSAAESNDLAAIRKSIIEGTNALNACAQNMADQGRESLAQLAAEVEGYRSRLKKTEQLSCQDALTGLANRRHFDQQLQATIQVGKPFCLILIDLNNFKNVNDRYGHLAGDDLLKQFAAELRAQFPSAAVVSRWGGDEFSVILGSVRSDAEARVERLRRWTLGEYTIKTGGESLRIPVDAAFGIVEWNGKETGREMIARADFRLYEGKQASRSVVR